MLKRKTQKLFNGQLWEYYIYFFVLLLLPEQVNLLLHLI